MVCFTLVLGRLTLTEIMAEIRILHTSKNKTKFDMTIISKANFFKPNDHTK